MSQAEPTPPIGDEMPEESEVTTDPGPPPQVNVKPGWRTSEGIITSALGLVLTVCAFMGWVTPSQASNWGDRLTIAVNNLWPFVAYIPVLWHYFTSRGKLKSNATLANAAILSPFIPNKLTNGNMQALGLLGGGGLGDILGRLGGGSGARDPATYIGLGKLIGRLTGGKLGKIIEKFPGGSSDTLDPREVAQSLTLIVDEVVHLQEQMGKVANLGTLLDERRKELEAVALTLWNGKMGKQNAQDFEGIIAQIKTSAHSSDK